ncbi:MAG: bifunctional folylpolyglutamate synthase/dihydrofolate synthase [Bacteroidetes bacterium]|nr:bifunctional folylpolyglutamate synthase/dihydrofolate synthase [Bacteroidota bacterium]
MFTRVGAIAFKKDLTNTLALCDFLDQPHHKFKSIHVAGTNGKGSSSHMLAAVLLAAGYKTGLYTSPHLRDFRERIRVNGEMISESEVIGFTSRMEEKIEEIQPSFFELGVAMAFDHFARHQVDIAVIETGMGGRLDSTNVITPLVSLITNIGYDHMEFLGNELAAIAGEKAGIIKEKVPVVIGTSQQETSGVFSDKAQQMHAPLFFADQTIEMEFLERNNYYQKFRVTQHDKSYDLSTDLLGSYQRYNIPGVLMTLQLIEDKGFSVNQTNIQKGLMQVKESTGLMGRWQWLSENPRVVCDTGHNEDGIREVLGMLEMEDYKKLHFILGMVGDKDVEKVLKMFPKAAKYYFTQAKIPRAMPAQLLAQKAAAVGLQGIIIPDVPSALRAAKESADKNDLIFLGGSTFVVAEVV